jgi:hypothetical protein
MNAGYFLIQLSSEKDKERVYKLIGQYSRSDANGVPQVCFIGVTNPQSPRVETPQFAMIFCSPRSTSQKSGWAQRTTAVSRPSASSARFVLPSGAPPSRMDALF